MILRITTPRLCAGVTIARGRVFRAAPCFARYKGLHKFQLMRIARAKGWIVEEIYAQVKEEE